MLNLSTQQLLFCQMRPNFGIKAFFFKARGGTNTVIVLTLLRAHTETSTL